MEGPLGIDDGSNRASLSELKNKLYDLLLTSSDQRSDSVQLDQKLGVSITKAAQRDGNVQIIQLQNANVYHITEKVVDALKLVDSIEQRILQRLPIVPNQLQLCEPQVDDCIPIDCVLLPKECSGAPNQSSIVPQDFDIQREFMDIMFRKNLDWKQMQKFVMAGYLTHVGAEFKGNRIQMSEFLKVQRTYISRKIGELKLTEVIDDDDSGGAGKPV